MHVYIYTEPPLTLVITPNGSPIDGQTYSLTCDLMGDESLDVADVDNRFRWDRLTPTFQSTLIRDPTLTFTPALMVADAGQYECTNNINSPYLTDSTTFTLTFTVSVSGKINHNENEWSDIIVHNSVSMCLFPRSPRTIPMGFSFWLSFRPHPSFKPHRF